jgi:hypothetical protein
VLSSPEEPVTDAGMRTSTSLRVPKYCTTALSRPWPASAACTCSSSTGAGYCTSTSVPPVKSMPKLSPRVASEISEISTSRPDSASMTGA